MGAGEVSAQSRAAAINVRVTVVRSCTVDTRPGAGPQATSVTCSRGATPGAVTTSATTTMPAASVNGAAIAPIDFPGGDIEAAHGSSQAASRVEVVTINF
jgi:hypothetical protein